MRATVRLLLRELARVEVVDRAMALGAQALLAVIPLLITLGAFLPDRWGLALLEQIRGSVGLDRETSVSLRSATLGPDGMGVQTGAFSLLLALVSATSFARALQRMYARVWELPPPRGPRALRTGLLWLVGWVVLLQAVAQLLHVVAGAPAAGVLRSSIQLVFNVGLWWWTARLLLSARVGWLALLPGAVASALGVVLLNLVSALLMPRSARVYVAEFGPLGVIFSIATWLVVFGGVLVMGALVGRMAVTTRWPALHAVPEEAGVAPVRAGYQTSMSESSNERPDREEPEVGLVADEDLPEDLQPTDDNPLAQDPEDREKAEAEKAEKSPKVEGMPDMKEPGTP